MSTVHELLASRRLRKLLRETALLCEKAEHLVFAGEEPKLPPVFIIGPPRSGSTLLFQSICQYFRCAYPVNLQRYLWAAPTLAAWMLSVTGTRYRSDFKSHYGKSSGWASPYTLLTVNLMIGREKVLRAGELDARATRYLRRTVGRLERIMGGPFISKSQRYNQWVQGLAEVFPSALFLVLLRQPLGVALSLLRARKEVHGDFRHWYLERPRSYRLDEGAPPEVQVVAQLQGIVDDIREDMEVVGADRFLAVTYEDLCAGPRALLEALRAELSDREVPLEVEGRLPTSFKAVKTRTDGLSGRQIDVVRQTVEEAFPASAYLALPCQWIRLAEESEV